MSNRTARQRTFATVFPAPEDRRCRPCGRLIPTGEDAWSPFYGGGWYHLTCDAAPTRPRPTAPDPVLLCESCGTEYRRDVSHAECARCHVLSLTLTAALA